MTDIAQTAPMMGGQPATSPGFFGVIADPRTYGSLVYMLLSLGTGIFYFTWAVTGLSLSAGFAFLIIGIPFFLVFVASVRLFAMIEGRLVEGLLGVPVPQRAPAPVEERGFWARVKHALCDVRTWSSLVYMVLMLPLGIAYFVTAVTGLSLSLGLALGGIASFLDGHQHFNVIEFHGRVGELMPPWVHYLAYTSQGNLICAAAGVLLLFVVLHLVRGVGRMHAWFAESLLVRG